MVLLLTISRQLLFLYFQEIQWLMVHNTVSLTAWYYIVTTILLIHNFWYVTSPFLFVSWFLKLFLLISSSNHWMLRNMLFELYIFEFSRFLFVTDFLVLHYCGQKRWCCWYLFYGLTYDLFFGRKQGGRVFGDEEGKREKGGENTNKNTYCLFRKIFLRS